MKLLEKTIFELYGWKSSSSFKKKRSFYLIKLLVPFLGLKQRYTKLNGGKDPTFLTSKIPLTDENNCVTGNYWFSLDISHIKQKRRNN